MKYRNYFNIDPEYYSQVNLSVINQNPDIWKKFYPHATFVKLINDTISVLARQQKLSIWVEGSYGTGKSHAVLTLKKLLEASEEDTRAYFEKYPDQLSGDLFKKFQKMKSGDKKIIAVHRYGSSSIDGDNALVCALQISISEALKENGMESKGCCILKDAAISWLSQSWANRAFDDLIHDKYRHLFGGVSADDVIQQLKTYTGDALVELVNNIAKIGDQEHINAFSLDVDGFVKWVKEIIRENNLKAIVFIWDEFTNYFEKNMKALSGFQQIAEISATDPFYLIIVTHKSSALFSDTDKDKERILDRFIKPTCNILLPENMAFRLMGSAMVKSDDPVVLDEWKSFVSDLYDRAQDSRKIVMLKAKIMDKELKNILPIHPYAALLLKHISSAFDSNQRSMFDFIKNDHGDEIKGFQWFIDNYGTEDANPFLTVDMLWSFFYERGKEYLSPDIRSILDSYSRATTKRLTPDEERVLKAVLLMEAISHKVGESVELFIPDQRNIDNVFEGSDLHSGKASRIAEKLCRDEILYRRPLGGDRYQFSALVNAGDMSAIEKLKEDFLQKTTTSDLIDEGKLREAFALTGSLKLRYKLELVTNSNMRIAVNTLRNRMEAKVGTIAAVVAVAKNDSESAGISKAIETYVQDPEYEIVFVDASAKTFGHNSMNRYAEAMANAKYQRGKDNGLANQYEKNAQEELEKWGKAIAEGDFTVSYRDNQGKVEKRSVASKNALYEVLSEITRQKFQYSLETGSSVIDNMWTANGLKLGVECGARQITKGTFASASNRTKLECYIGAGAWKQEEGEPYWQKAPHSLISEIKKQVVDTVEDSFRKEGRVPIAMVYEKFKAAPFGFLPCNLTAFVMGFVLKEFINGEYTWSDGIQNAPLTVERLKEMVAEVINLQITPNNRYRDKYIVKLTDDEKAFNNASSKIFRIPLEQCVNVEQTRERIRNEMKKLSFPIWSLKYLKDMSGLKTRKELIDKLIDLYGGIANNYNFADNKTDNTIALDIGSICKSNPDVIEDAVSIFTKQKCTEGMRNYLVTFEGGRLLDLAKEIGDNGQFINVLKSKFDADAARWVWDQETVNQKIREVILEYEITNESNKIISHTTFFDDTIKEWCEKAKYIRLPFHEAKVYLPELSGFLQLLYEMKKANVLTDQQKPKFYEALVQHGAGFREFYANKQVDCFKESCQYYIAPYKFSDAEVEALFKTLPVDCYVMEKSEYYNMLRNKVDDFKFSCGSTKLKNIWREKTGTNSPKEWSELYKMPILAMVDDSKLKEARLAFEAINNPRLLTASAIDKALDFLKNDDLFKRLADESERDKAFKRIVIRQYATLLTDINEVKNNLSAVANADPFDWYANPEVEKKICIMANAKYNEWGYEKALERINNMESSEVKSYLQALVRENMIVGMEIIK